MSDTRVSSSTPLERDARLITAREHRVAPSEVAVGVIIGRSSEFFDFFVYAIASVLVFPSLVFPHFDPLTGTLYSFAVFALAFIARPIGTLAFMAVDRRHGRGVKLTIALFLLGGSTMAIAFLPGYDQIGIYSVLLLAAMRTGQGLALGGVWDGLPSLLSLNAPKDRRGWYAMIPQLGAPVGLIVAAGLFAFFLSTLSTADFLDWGWRYPFFVAFAINAVALFARLRLVATPDFERLYETRELQPAPVGETLRHEGRLVLLGAFAPLASFAMFHLVTVFPLSWSVLESHAEPMDFLLLEMAGAAVGVLSVIASGLIADRLGRRPLLGASAVLIGVYSGFAPQLLDQGRVGEAAYLILGFLLLGLGFGQASGTMNSGFSPRYRYTGAAITSDLAWLIGAGFAPLTGLWLASRFGLASMGGYLLSGAICTLAALWLNKLIGRRIG